MTALQTAPQELDEPACDAGRLSPGELKFEKLDDFYLELRRRVDAHFAATGLDRRDCPRMYLKSGVILTWFAASYISLLLAPTWWIALPLGLLLALSMAAIGFNIMHDGGHSAYSRHPWINNLAAWSLDMLGGSSFVWDQKHMLHHNYANIAGHDEDINLGLLGRVSPHQKHLPFHRLQHFYLWVLYGLMPLKWQLWDDFEMVIAGRIGDHRLRRPVGAELCVFLLGKAAFFTLALVIPTLVLGSFWKAFACYAAITFVQGLSMSIIFQLPHCGDESAFPIPSVDTGRMDTTWAVHQVLTTVNYAPGNRLVTWYVGGLNYQIEHHLFPRICHIHYPALAPLVEKTCQDFGLPYRSYPTFRAGIQAHYRLLRLMGRPVDSDLRRSETRGDEAAAGAADVSL